MLSFSLIFYTTSFSSLYLSRLYCFVFTIASARLVRRNTGSFCGMGACASRFTVLKNASDAPPPEVESREVNPVEEVAVKKDDAALVEDEASRRQSLGHLLSEIEEKEDSVESDGTEVKPEAAADDASKEEAPVADGLMSNSLEEEKVLACQNVAIEAETVKLETKDEVETLKMEKPEEDKLVQKIDESAEDTKCETSETEKIEVEKPSDAEKKETDEKSIVSAVIETPEKKLEVAEKQNPNSEAETKNGDDKNPESPETEETEQKHAEGTQNNEKEEKPAENTEVETSEAVEDKHVLEPQTTENCSVKKETETSSVELKPASDAEKPKAEEGKANS